MRSGLEARKRKTNEANFDFHCIKDGRLFPISGVVISIKGFQPIDAHSALLLKKILTAMNWLKLKPLPMGCSTVCHAHKPCVTHN